MRAVLTVDEMRQVDKDALQAVSESVLVERAGNAVAVRALRILGGAYAKRVLVIAGKGNNGADGRVAAQRLRVRGARVVVVDAADAADVSDKTALDRQFDLVIDAAYGTGFRGSYIAPSLPSGGSGSVRAQVLAVDIPSGIDGDTGAASGEPMRADLTLTFAALKPGLLQGDGPALCGRIEVADIGFDASRAHIWLVEDDDVRRMLPARSRDTNKWKSAVCVVAGSPGMMGAAAFCSTAAYRAGAGMVRLAVPGAGTDLLATEAAEAVALEIPRHGWASQVLEVAERCGAVVIGPGIGRDAQTAADVKAVVAACPVPVVVDADGLFALGDADAVSKVAKSRSADAGPLVLTPHSGEFARMFGAPPGADRITDTRAAAAKAGSILLLKGSTTVVASSSPSPSSRARSGSSAGDEYPGQNSEVRIVMSGGPSLATAGTGDVLSGAIAAFIARGVPPFEAAALAAHVHGRASGLGRAEGLVAGDLPDLISRWLSAELHPGGARNA
jgi:NAD(P)H-hydrate epimerase